MFSNFYSLAQKSALKRSIIIVVIIVLITIIGQKVKECTGKKYSKTYNHMHNCKLAGGKCCSENASGSPGKTCDSSQTYCGYCFSK